MTTQKLTREEKATQMFASGMMIRTTDDGWEVPGSKGNTYAVHEETDGTYTCECGDFLWRHQLMCKHVLFVRMHQDMRKLHEQMFSMEKVIC